MPRHPDKGYSPLLNWAEATGRIDPATRMRWVQDLVADEVRAEAALLALPFNLERVNRARVPVTVLASGGITDWEPPAPWDPTSLRQVTASSTDEDTIPLTAPRLPDLDGPPPDPAQDLAGFIDYQAARLGVIPSKADFDAERDKQIAASLRKLYSGQVAAGADTADTADATAFLAHLGIDPNDLPSP